MFDIVFSIGFLWCYDNGGSSFWKFWIFVWLLDYWYVIKVIFCYSGWILFMCGFNSRFFFFGINNGFIIDIFINFVN